MSEHVDVIIVGAGVVGCAIARELSRCDLSICVLEQSSDVGNATSKANTAILHTGFDCVPGSLESTLVSRGYDRLLTYAEQRGIAVEKTGAILVAWDEDQRAELPGLQEKAIGNGYHHTRILEAPEIYEREPHLGPGVLGGLEVPDESIIDPWSPIVAFATQAKQAGVTFVFNASVGNVANRDGRHHVTTSQGNYSSTWLINAAGLFSDSINDYCGHHEFTITPRRGELIVFDKLARSLVSSIILPVPTATTKGVLVSPTAFGNVLLGPTADDIDDKNATATTNDGIARLMEAGRRIMPELIHEEVTATYAGLRAATEHRDYQIHLHAAQRYICVGGIRSTGLTASMAIGDYVASLLGEAGVTMTPNTRFRDELTMPPLGESQCRPSQDPSKIAADPAYGHVLCHCEHVSAGEIRDAVRAVMPATTQEGLRRRTRAMNGRCQGFYCSAQVLACFEASFDE